MSAIGKRLVRASLAVGGSVALVLAMAGTAAAAKARDGVCDRGEFCLYWGANMTGSLSDFVGSIPDYGNSQPTCYDFKTPGLPGYGECVKNNAMSAWNVR